MPSSFKVMRKGSDTGYWLFAVCVCVWSCVWLCPLKVVTEREQISVILMEKVEKTK